MIERLDVLTGMHDAAIKRLRESAGIKTLLKFADATLTVESRQALQQRSQLPALMIYNWAKQADLLRCEQLTPEEAEQLNRAGIRCLADLANADASRLAGYLKEVKIDPHAKEDRLLELIVAAGQLASGFEPDLADRYNPQVISRSSQQEIRNSLASFGSTYGSDLADVITELGKGIAQAQRQLDMMSIETQNQILRDRTLSRYGYNATWYAIPEVDFTLKMEYSFTQERDSRRMRMNVVPMNANYSNIFRSKSERNADSTLNLRFVPVPAPESFTHRNFMPNLLGATREEADEIMESLGCRAEYIVLAGKPTNDEFTEVVRQAIPAGTQLVLGEVVQLLLFDEEMSEEAKQLFQERERLARVLCRHLEQLKKKR